MYKHKQINDLSPQEIGQIIWLSTQGDYYCNKTWLICNLYSISTNLLEEILIKYSHDKVFSK